MWIWEESIILLCQIIAPSGNINWILVTTRAESIHWNYLFCELFYFFISKNACESIITSLSIFQEIFKDFFLFACKLHVIAHIHHTALMLFPEQDF